MKNHNTNKNSIEALVKAMASIPECRISVLHELGCNQGSTRAGSPIAGSLRPLGLLWMGDSYEREVPIKNSLPQRIETALKRVEEVCE